MFPKLGLLTEVFFTIAVVFLCLLIYFRTRDLYTLTKHKGIEYFRKTFLFFAFAYLFRFIFYLLMFVIRRTDLFVPREVLNPLFIIPVGYCGTMAILCLIYSSVWKKMDEIRFVMIANIFAFSVSIISYFFRSPIILVVLQFGLFVAAILSSYFAKKSKKLGRVFTLYVLLFVFWLVSLFNFGPRIYIPLNFKIVMFLMSLGIFAYIYHKVSKWAK